MEHTRTGTEGKNENIDELLNSALEDLENIPKKTKKSKTKVKKSVEDELMGLMEKVGFAGSTRESLNAEMLNLSKMAEKNRAESSATSIQDALNQLALDSEKLQELPTEEEMNKMFDGVQGADLEQGLGNLIPMMEGMMQTLLSKDLLYPAMKDLNDRFPDWLADNRQTLPETEYAKYNKQFDLARKICIEFESEKEVKSSNSDDKERFERIMGLMQVIYFQLS